ncbi:MAG: hypothetical protein JJ964_12110 [Rhizobiales bacterium]|nr:hypothetical protein [Hyphomicrobiales bacterium]
MLTRQSHSTSMRRRISRQTSAKKSNSDRTANIKNVQSSSS